MKFRSFWAVLALILVFPTNNAVGDLKSKVSELEKLVSGGQHSAALESIRSLDPESLSDADKATHYFVKGILLFRSHRWAEAKTELLKAKALGSELKTYIYYHLGLIEKNLGQVGRAVSLLNQALALKPSKNIRYEIRFALGELSVAKRHFLTAYKHYRYLQRRWKWSDKYPMILKRLVEVDLARKKRWRACRWARNLYRNFPAHPQTQDWSVDLQNVEVGNRKLGCLASFNDQKRRIRRLQWSGASQQARAEIDVLLNRSSKRTRYDVDKLFANFLMNEGYTDESVQVLLKYYTVKKGDFDYLMLFGRAAAKAGRFQTAVGSYDKAHKLKRRGSKQAREALFKAAFLSYQFQDYDGAFRKFKSLRKLYPRSARARDAKWHLAWLKYLRQDYKGAIKSFREIKRLARRRPRRWRKHPKDKVNYWLAMSYFRSGDFGSAQMLFSNLITDNVYSFYAQAAKSRVQEIPDSATVPARSLSSSDVESVLTRTSGAQGPPEVDEPEDKTIDVAEDIAKNEIQVEDEGDDPVEKDEDEKPLLFKSRKHNLALKRATTLISMGFYDWARWELYFIERTTRHKTYRRNLVDLFRKIKSFNRSAYISSIYFGEERRSQGFDAARDLWEAAYPVAYENIVNHFSEQFGIEKEFVLSIMRAESFFKADVSSPVGARGLMQLMPHTASQVSRLLGDESFNAAFLIRPEVNVRVGTRYLQRLSKKFKGQIPLMAAGYNAGPHRVDSWLTNFGHLDMDEFIEHIPFKETRNYVKKVTRNYAIYKELYSNTTQPVAWLNGSIVVPPNTRHNTRETWERL